MGVNTDKIAYAEKYLDDNFTIDIEKQRIYRITNKKEFIIPGFVADEIELVFGFDNDETFLIAGNWFHKNGLKGLSKNWWTIPSDITGGTSYSGITCTGTTYFSG